MPRDNDTRSSVGKDSQEDPVLPDYEKIQAGDPGAWSQGFKILWGVAHAACHGALKNCQAVDKDLVVSDAVTEVIAKASEVGSWEELKALTARVAWCRAIDAVRKTKAQKYGGGQLDSLEDMLVEPASPQFRQPDKELYYNEIWGSYQQCAQELNPKSREVMELKLLEQLTQKEISEKLKIPQGTVGVMIMKILETVRRCLETRGFAPQKEKI